MELKGVLLLAAPGARAKAYLQALVTAGLGPERLILLRGNDVPSPGYPAPWQDLFIPDFAEPLAETGRRGGIEVVPCDCDSVNDPRLVATVRDQGARLAIYCGPGGQIAGPELLGAGIPLLHVHSGWLPDYRGSTTLYYALLEGEAPGATAFLLDRTIDTGPVLARRRYPPPPAGMDVDQCYDPIIRADLLVRVLRDFRDRGELPEGEAQDMTGGRTYYVIHPVLKHIALLSLARAQAP